MKKISMFGALIGALFGVTAYAADITVYYSPTCPHCHHARDFIENELVYEYNDIKVATVNVMDMANRQEFLDTIQKCEYKSGGVPVMVIGEKCFQGYADSMQQDLRMAIEIDLTDAQKQAATNNKAEFDKDKAAFVAAHANRKDAITERIVKKN